MAAAGDAAARQGHRVIRRASLRDMVLTDSMAMVSHKKGQGVAELGSHNK